MSASSTLGPTSRVGASAASRASHLLSIPSLSAFFAGIRNMYQRFMQQVDRFAPYHLFRWIFAGAFFALYVVRVLWIQGFYVVTYALSIYLLNVLLLFLTPKFNPELSMDEISNDSDLTVDGDSGPLLPTTGAARDANEFRPFIRRLPEFKFWFSTVRAILISFTLTLFSFCDIPVYWPILLVYFIFLFAFTMKRQIKHMIKYKYVPFDLGKKTYATSPAGNRPVMGKSG